MEKRQPKQRRKRGVFLSHTGWQRLQAAERKFEVQENQGTPSTLEILSEKTKLSPNTLTKVRRQQTAVDRQTLEAYFKAFGLSLTTKDYQSVEAAVFSPALTTLIPGQLALGSPFYISRPKLEAICYETVLQPGALLHLRSPHQLGKTSLITRILVKVREQGLNAQMLSFRLIDNFVTDSFEGLLRWFCAVITRRLGLPERLSDLWDPQLGNSFNCTVYFEQYLLNQLSGALVLVLDDIDRLFRFPELAADFLNMLRTWNEMAQYGDHNGKQWQKLRLVLLHNHQVSCLENSLTFPADFGITLDLPAFSETQIATLIERYGIDSMDGLASTLMHFLGGNPNLVQLTLHAMHQKQMTLEQITQTVTAPDSIFADHLLHYYQLLSQHPILEEGIRQIVQGEQPGSLSPVQIIHLVRLGLITCKDQKLYVQSQLYRDYFKYVLC